VFSRLATDWFWAGSADCFHIDIVAANHEQVAQLLALPIEKVRVAPEIEEDFVRKHGQILLARRESDPRGLRPLLCNCVSDVHLARRGGRTIRTELQSWRAHRSALVLS
jgi:hypothetical protein